MEPAKNESLRVKILAAVFPGMRVSGGTVPIRKIIPRQPGTFRPIDFPDALAGERQYSVAGEPANETEMCAAENMLDRSFSRVRKLQFKVFVLPSTHDAVAVIQYSFANSNPAGSCWSVGRIVRLSLEKHEWRVTQDRMLEDQHHSAFQEINLIDLDNDGFGELIVDSDWGGAGNIGSNLLIFSLRKGQLEEWLRITSRYEGDEGSFEQRFDVTATKATSGQRFCFRKIQYAEADYKVLPKPRVNAVCYPRYDGVKSR